jgi:hypothetical protein
MIVAKVGGGTSLNTDAVVADIVALTAKGTELLLVHGGAQTTNAVAEALGHPAQQDVGREAEESREVAEPKVAKKRRPSCESLSGQRRTSWMSNRVSPSIHTV